MQDFDDASTRSWFMRVPSKGALRSLQLFALLLAVSLSNAADTVQRLKAPAAAEQRAVKAELKAHFATYERKGAESASALIRDETARQAWTDLEYRIVRAIHEGRSLGDLSEFGLESKPDGSYTVDLKRFPQWQPLDASLPVLSTPEAISLYEERLKARGFRQSDMDDLRLYVAEHDLTVATQAAATRIAEKYARHFADEAAAGRPLAADDVIDYRYELRRSWRETEREWSLALLDGLDKQRQRILASFFQEVASTKNFGKAQKNARQMLEMEASALASGEYLSAHTRAEAQLRQEAEDRRRKLMEDLSK
jgi:hypothetical protein